MKFSKTVTIVLATAFVCDAARTQGRNSDRVLESPTVRVCAQTPDGSPYNTEYGDCSTYAPGAGGFIAPGEALPNYDYCDSDFDSNGIIAEDACSECGKCADEEEPERGPEPTFDPTPEPNEDPTAESTISEQCIADTEALYSNTDLAVAAEELEVNCLSHTSMTDDFTLIMDWTECQAAKDFQDTCINAGGQPIVSPTIDISCEAVGLAFVMRGIPDCFGISCDAAILQSELVQVLDVHLEAMLGTDCDVQLSDTASRHLVSADAKAPLSATKDVLQSIATKRVATLLSFLNV